MSDREENLPTEGASAGSRALRALVTSALSLPGIANQALADAPRERDEASYRFSYYKEDRTSSNKVPAPSTTIL